MARLMNGNLVVLAIIGMIMSLPFGNSDVLGQCRGDIAGLVRLCTSYVVKTSPPGPPSPACCNVIKNTDVLCVCHHVSKQILQSFDMQKVFHVTHYCGNPLPVGTQCGTIGSSEP